MLISIGEAAVVAGVSVSTMRRWEKEKRCLSYCRTQGGHRRYRMSDLIPKKEETARYQRTLIYGRVSSHDQKADLERQIQKLESYCCERGLVFDTIRDLGSGLNFKKRGLKKLIRCIVTQKVDQIVLTHKDRLLRFGSELVFELCKYFGVKIIMIDEKNEKSAEETLAADVLEILTVFSARLYGQRSHSKRNKVA